MSAILEKETRAQRITEEPAGRETPFPLSAAPEMGALLRECRHSVEAEERRRIEAKRREEEAKRRAERPAFGYD